MLIKIRFSLITMIITIITFNGWMQMFKWCVEVVYDGEQNVITEVHSFKSGHPLNKYSYL